MPLVAPFRTSFGTETVRDVLLVRVETADGDGWGECVADAEPALLAASTSTAPQRRHRADTSCRGCAAARPPDAGDRGRVAPAARGGQGPPDGEGGGRDGRARRRARARRAARSATTSGRSPTGCPRGLASASTDSVPAAARRRGRLPRRGLPADQAQDRAGLGRRARARRARAVRRRLLLQVDANTAYTAADARHLARLDPFGLLLIEQPLPEDDVLGPRRAGAAAAHADLPRRVDHVRPGRRRRDRAGRVLASSTSRPGRVGGYLEARRVHDVCAANGVPVWCGGMLETGLGRAANVALAALPGFTLPGDTSASRPLLRARPHASPSNWTAVT